jgi:hypothetical protein
MDICIAIDGSASLSNDNFADEKTFVKNLFGPSGLVVSQTGVRTYMWDFASLVNAQWEWIADENNNNAAFTAGVDAIVKVVGVTKLADVMFLCANTSFPSAQDRPTAAKVALIITDGLNNSPLDMGDAANALNAAAPDGVYAVGVGNVDAAGLATIAGSNVYTVADWTDLADELFAQLLLSQFCTPGAKECNCCCPEPKYPFLSS